MSAELTDRERVDLVIQRAEFLQRARAFFYHRGLLEVDVPILVQGAPLDAHIDLFEVQSPQGRRFLHSSPEHGMKRLLAAGCPDCFQISHVFRLGEWSDRHNPEFLMAEWYRRGWPLDQLIDETVALIREFLGPRPVRHRSYWELLGEAIGREAAALGVEELLDLLRQQGQLLSREALWSRTDLIQLLFALLVEPRLGRGTIDVVIDWPEDQAAHARRVEKSGRRVAQRFEAYCEGLELCNGYDEVIDVGEQRQRFLATNAQREAEGKEPYLIDERLLEVLSKMPPSSGVAVGLDRVFQLAMRKVSLQEVLPLPWREA